MRVLAIDDQPEVLKQIEKAIAGADGIDGQPYDVVGLDDHQEAMKRQQVTERRLGGDALRDVGHRLCLNGVHGEDHRHAERKDGP